MEKELTQNLIHICAWCHYIYDDNGKRLIHIDDGEYQLFESHGICTPCKDSLLNRK